MPARPAIALAALLCGSPALAQESPRPVDAAALDARSLLEEAGLSEAAAAIVERRVSEPADAEVLPRPEGFELPTTTGGRLLSVSADIGLHSAYASRGLNVFSSGGPQEAAALLAPSLEVGFGESGVRAGWIGALQLTGENAEALVASGVGAENDLVLSWSRGLGETLEVGAAATLILYPFADAGVAGAATGVEPSVHLDWSGPVDLGAELVYSTLVAPSADAPPYAYLRIAGGRTASLGGIVDLRAEAGVGYKAYADPEAPTDNRWDVTLDLTVERAIGEHLYLAPGLHGVWTDLEGKDFGASAFAWGGVNLGGSWG